MEVSRGHRARGWETPVQTGVGRAAPVGPPEPRGSWMREGCRRGAEVCLPAPSPPRTSLEHSLYPVTPPWAEALQSPWCSAAEPSPSSPTLPPDAPVQPGWTPRLPCAPRTSLGSLHLTAPPSETWSPQPISPPARSCCGGRSPVGPMSPSHASRGCVLAPPVSGCNHLESQHCISVPFVSPLSPLHSCCVLVAL